LDKDKAQKFYYRDNKVLVLKTKEKKLYRARENSSDEDKGNKKKKEKI
jgi:hypothetical protein